MSTLQLAKNSSSKQWWSRFASFWKQQKGNFPFLTVWQICGRGAISKCQCIPRNTFFQYFHLGLYLTNLSISPLPSANLLFSSFSCTSLSFSVFHAFLNLTQEKEKVVRRPSTASSSEWIKAHPVRRCCSPAGSSGGQTWLSGSGG